MNATQLGRYQLIGVLGQGAMGVVYEARDPHLDRLVAIKTIRMSALTPDQAAAYERRFLTEARSAARLRHPAIVNVYDAGKDVDVTYLVMEKVHGINLKHCLNHGVKFSVAGAVRIVVDILSGLDHAHQQRVIHRDVKPENILMDAQGTVKLTDFGIAKMQDPGADNGTQVSGLSIGTPRYMSPEQIRGLDVDARSDLFSAGVLLYELLTGSLPFDGNSHMAVATRILHEVQHPASGLRHDVPPAIDEVLAVALAKVPGDRYDSASAFSTALIRASEGKLLTLARSLGSTGGNRAQALVEPDSVGTLTWLLQGGGQAPGGTDIIPQATVTLTESPLADDMAAHAATVVGAETFAATVSATVPLHRSTPTIPIPVRDMPAPNAMVTQVVKLADWTGGGAQIGNEPTAAIPLSTPVGLPTHLDLEPVPDAIPELAVTAAVQPVRETLVPASSDVVAEPQTAPDATVAMSAAGLKESGANPVAAPALVHGHGAAPRRRGLWLALGVAALAVAAGSWMALRHAPPSALLQAVAPATKSAEPVEEVIVPAGTPPAVLGGTPTPPGPISSEPAGGATSPASTTVFPPKPPRNPASYGKKPLHEVPTPEAAPVPNDAGPATPAAPTPKPAPAVSAVVPATRVPALVEPCVGLSFFERESCLWKQCYTDAFKRHPVCKRFQPENGNAPPGR